MACINPNSPEFKEILLKVNNPLLAEIEMDKSITTDDITSIKNNVSNNNTSSINTTTIQEANNFDTKQNIEDLFETDTELADAIYKALGYKEKVADFTTEYNLYDIITLQQKQQAIEIYSQYLQSLEKPNTNPILQNNQSVISSNDRIIFGHPGIGKTFAKKSNDFIDVDEDYKEEHTMQKALRNHAKNTGKEKDLKAWEDYVTDWWTKVKSDAVKSGKQIFVSNLPILRLFPQDFDKVITISEETFVNRSKQRNDYKQGDTEDWKNSLDIEIAKIDKSKVVTTDKYLSDLFDNTKQEQVKKFVELQERLNNKEFVGSAKNVYDNSKELQELGTQEQYIDFIARVALGIIRNPSSGDFNDSKVTDIVYHGTGKYNAEEILQNGFDSTLQGENKVIFFTGDVNQSFSRLGGKIDAIVNIEQLFNNRFTSLLNKANENSDSFYYPTEVDVNSSLYEVIKKRNPGNIFIDKYGKTAEVTVLSPEQIHILSSKQDIEEFKQYVSTIDDKHLKDVKNAIIDNLPVEISSIITVVNEVPIEVLGRDDLYLSIKKFLIDNGIEDEILINWVGINKDRFGHPKNIKSTEQLLSIIDKRYNELKNIDNHPELKRNDLALESFNKWVIALERYPIAFREVMLTHAIKYLNPLRRAKYVLQLSDVALMNTYGILVGKPHELNRMGKLYDKEVIVAVSDAIGHEPSASGKGYWVHIPRTKKALTKEDEDKLNTTLEKFKNPKDVTKTFGYNNTRYYVENNIIHKLSSGISLSDFEVNSLVNEIENKLKNNTSQFKTNVELLRKLSPSTWCTASGMASHYVENYDNYLLIVNGITVAGIEAGNIGDNGKVQVKEVTSIANNGIASVDHIDDIVAFFEKHNIDLDNDSIQYALEAKKEGVTDAEMLRDEEEYYDDNIYPPDDYNPNDFYDFDDDRDRPDLEYRREEDERTRLSNEDLNRRSTVVENLNTVEEVLQNPDFLEFFELIKPELRNNEEIARKGIENSPYYITFIAPNLPFYNDLVTIAITNAPDVFQYLPDAVKEQRTDLKEIYDTYIIKRDEATAERINQRVIAQINTIDEIFDGLPFSKTNQNLIQGYYDVNTDKVVVVASNITVEEAPRIAIHEVAHAGMLRMSKLLFEGKIKETVDTMLLSKEITKIC